MEKINNKILVCAPIFVLSFVLSDLSGMHKHHGHHKYHGEQDIFNTLRAGSFDFRGKSTTSTLQPRQRQFPLEDIHETEDAFASSTRDVQRQPLNPEVSLTNSSSLPTIEESSPNHQQSSNEELTDVSPAPSRRGIAATTRLPQRDVSRSTIEHQEFLSSFVSGIANIIRESSADHDRIRLPNLCVTIGSGKHKELVIQGDVQGFSGSRKINYRVLNSNDSISFDIFDLLCNRMELNGNLLNLYASLPTYAMNYRVSHFNKMNEIVKNLGLPLLQKAYMIKSFMEESRLSQLVKFSALKNMNMTSEAAIWFYYFLYSALYNPNSAARENKGSCVIQ